MIPGWDLWVGGKQMWGRGTNIGWFPPISLTCTPNGISPRFKLSFQWVIYILIIFSTISTNGKGVRVWSIEKNISFIPPFLLPCCLRHHSKAYKVGGKHSSHIWWEYVGCIVIHLNGFPPLIIQPTNQFTQSSIGGYMGFWLTHFERYIDIKYRVGGKGVFLGVREIGGVGDYMR